MTLQELKEQSYGIYMSRVHMMRDLIEDPSDLRYCGYKTLEDALTKITLGIVKDVEKLNVQYEKDNPDA